MIPLVEQAARRRRRRAQQASMSAKNRAERYDERVKDADGYDVHPGAPEHGTRSIYVGWGCHCKPCRDANSEYWADYWKRRTAANA